LLRLQRMSEGGAKVVQVDYGRLRDPQLLQPFFRLSSNSSLPDLIEKNGPEPQKLSNFMGMLAFLHLCQGAADKELCVYLDSDIFLHRHPTGEGIVDLAAKVFDEHRFASLMPPTGCLHEKANHGICRTEPAKRASSRYIIVNRTRFVAALPLVGKPEWFGPPHPAFEKVWSMVGKDAHLLGQMMCGGDVFAVHPPSRFQFRHPTALSLKHLLVSLAGVADEEHHNVSINDDPVHRGLRLLINRLESGRFEADKDSIWNDGMKTCEDMLGSSTRVASGLAWF